MAQIHTCFLRFWPSHSPLCRHWLRLGLSPSFSEGVGRISLIALERVGIAFYNTRPTTGQNHERLLEGLGFLELGAAARLVGNSDNGSQ